MRTKSEIWPRRLIVEGTALVQVEGEAAIEVSAGSAFYEPAEAVIRFDNASSVVPRRFVCFYLLDEKQQLIKMVPAGR